AWTADFNPHTVQHTIAQTWIRIHGLAREYWRPTILFEIAGALGIPLALDEATMKRTFGHFARVLIEVDLNSDLHERILVERNAFDFYVDIEYEKLPLFCNSCQIIGHSVKNCKYQTPKAIASSTTVNKPKARPTSNVEKPLESSIPNIATNCSKIVVEIDPIVDDIIRSKEAMTSMFVGDVLNHEKENPFISVEATPVCVQDTASSSGMASPIVGDVLNLENEVFCEELHEEDEVVADSIPLENQAKSIVVSDSNLSNFSANVIHDMQVLGLL
ncbi:NADPH:quinone oxidoreductase-like, partial [Trifolium medium]|nr:NADPH:quinone oxidoreductase-like [Trifolium medium]